MVSFGPIRESPPEKEEWLSYLFLWFPLCSIVAGWLHLSSEEPFFHVTSPYSSGSIQFSSLGSCNCPLPLLSGPGMETVPPLLSAWDSSICHHPNSISLLNSPALPARGLHPSWTLMDIQVKIRICGQTQYFLVTWTITGGVSPKEWRSLGPFMLNT